LHVERRVTDLNGEEPFLPEMPSRPFSFASEGYFYFSVDKIILMR
jgi:hypothetical protein